MFKPIRSVTETIVKLAPFFILMCSLRLVLSFLFGPLNLVKITNFRGIQFTVREEDVCIKFKKTELADVLIPTSQGIPTAHHT